MWEIQGLEEEEITERDIHSTMEEIGVGNDGGKCTAFTVSMLCIDEEFEFQALEFLPSAFDAFPDKV